MKILFKSLVLMVLLITNLVFCQSIFEKGTVLVKFKEIENIRIEGIGVSGKNKSISNILQEHKLKGRRIIGKDDYFYRLKFPDSQSLDAIINKLRSDDKVQYATRNHGGRISSTPNDPKWQLQWAYEKINLPAAWDITTGDSNILVGVLDSGIDYNHADLVANISNTYGWDFVDDDNNPQDPGMQADYHGTRVSGVIAARTNNNTGVAGIAGGWSGQNGVILMVKKKTAIIFGFD
ncbi:MAG: S8 family serine peptidase [Candidatus Marinimicrobia bacterium]|nr:S8 family serine peptidase [Candidatus Neomarinimicrobiota bacterium]MBL7011292.1 S8 family serine peptidase [Candidatus Neomarinimicrobiota bacterium]MBL7031458.1 S8 family serine peptidase [Candidatus Neomarinimicrobiota bacterium]